ncbi:unnamed protein product [Prorocentrum cordatum]|uniref:Uncharacterized protein n=1 Tax=Prorocentrum cordatum TaxID=2364126 RepID=A0ABN9TTN9_9DINO|nr:unnamed protein product [Polarella glacialis]
MTTRSLPLVLCAACCYVAAASGQECWGMGETCGDDARCSGMDTRCGDRSECSGSSSTCGANSICSGIGSQCGPGSQCTGLGSLCAGGGQQAQSESEGPMHFKPMQPMHFKKMHFEPMKTEKPQKVFVHGCDQGDVCSGRPDAAQSNGVTVCCQEGCAECSASTSQSGNELTATCVCSRARSNDNGAAKAPGEGDGLRNGQRVPRAARCRADCWDGALLPRELRELHGVRGAAGWRPHGDVHVRPDLGAHGGAERAQGQG